MFRCCLIGRYIFDSGGRGGGGGDDRGTKYKHILLSYLLSYLLIKTNIYVYVVVDNVGGIFNY